MEETVNMRKYIIRFIIAYIIVMLIMSSIDVFFLEESMDSTSILISAMMGAAGHNVFKFVDDNKRILYKSEKTKLVWASLFVLWVHLLISFVINYNTIEINYLWSSLTLIMISIMFYIGLNFIYVSFGKLRYNNIKKYK